MKLGLAHLFAPWQNFFSFGFGLGLAPVAPGTFGTLAALPLYLLMFSLTPVVYGLVLLGLFVVGVYFCEQTSTALGVHDHGAIVWDEVVGYLIALWALPFEWPWVLLAFVLFRFFDIIKPWPIRWIDQSVHGGFGVMLDDVLAGFMALAVAHIVLAVV